MKIKVLFDSQECLACYIYSQEVKAFALEINLARFPRRSFWLNWQAFFFHVRLSLFHRQDFEILYIIDLKYYLYGDCSAHSQSKLRGREI